MKVSYGTGISKECGGTGYSRFVAEAETTEEEAYLEHFFKVSGKRLAKRFPLKDCE